MSYQFCKPFEGNKDEDYMMHLKPEKCGEVEGVFVYMCSEHINVNQKEVLRLKMDQRRRSVEMGVPETPDYEDILATG